MIYTWYRFLTDCVIDYELDNYMIDFTQKHGGSDFIQYEHRFTLFDRDEVKSDNYQPNYVIFDSPLQQQANEPLVEIVKYKLSEKPLF